MRVPAEGVQPLGFVVDTRISNLHQTWPKALDGSTWAPSRQQVRAKPIDKLSANRSHLRKSGSYSAPRAPLRFWHWGQKNVDLCAWTILRMAVAVQRGQCWPARS